MKKTNFRPIFISLVILSLLFIGLIPSSVRAAVPGKINYQGKLIDSEGQVLNGKYNIDFTLFTEVSGGDGVWSESHAKIAIVNGIFSVMLGSSSPLTEVVLNSDWLWMELTVNNEKLLPRRNIVGTGFALKTSGFTVDPAGRVGIGTDSPENELHIMGEVKGSIGDRGYFMIPENAIIMWSGAIAAIPEGWQLCDGSSGTPDLRGQFVYGVVAGEEPGATGGSASHTHTFSADVSASTNLAGSHSHSYSQILSHYHSIDPPNWESVGAGSHLHSVDYPPANTNTTGSHAHGIPAKNSWGQYVDGYAGRGDVNGSNATCYTSSDGHHSHSVTIPACNSTTAANHTHTLNIDSFSSGATGSASCSTELSDEHRHTLADSTAAGVTGPSSTLPPYFTIAFITPVKGS